MCYVVIFGTQHYGYSQSNNIISRHVYGVLVCVDAKSEHVLCAH